LRACHQMFRAATLAVSVHVITQPRSTVAAVACVVMILTETGTAGIVQERIIRSSISLAASLRSISLAASAPQHQPWSIRLNAPAAAQVLHV